MGSQNKNQNQDNKIKKSALPTEFSVGFWGRAPYFKFDYITKMVYNYYVRKKKILTLGTRAFRARKKTTYLGAPRP
jgi:hypothetical protein